MRLRMIADVPLGAFLSGGVIPALSWPPWPACPARRCKPAPSVLTTRALMNRGYAKRVAERYRTNHRMEIVSADDFDLIDTLAWLYDEDVRRQLRHPPPRLHFQMAHKHVTVAVRATVTITWWLPACGGQR